MSRDNYLVRSEVLVGFDDLVEELGADPEYFYRRVGLTAALLENPDFMVPCESVCTLLDTVAKALNVDDLGLRMGSKRKVFQVGVLWPLIVNSPRVDRALLEAMKHFHLHNRGVLWQLDTEGDRAMLTRVDRVATDVPTFHWAVYSTCAMVAAMRALCGKEWCPISVSFIHPPPADSKAYDRFFGIKAAFNREFNRIVFPTFDLDSELADNKHLFGQLDKQIQELEEEYERQADFCEKIKLLVEQRMHTVDCTQVAIAKTLSLHPKALQRELKNRGVSFRELKVEVRLDMAERYLKDSEIPLTTIADILGFSELSSFSHAFKSRHHIPPAIWRDQVRASL